jgi:diaminopimelate decarboxylase
VGGGFGVRHVLGETAVDLGALAGAVAAAVGAAWDEHGLPAARMALEPGRALVGRAGVTLYRVRSVKRLDFVTWVAVDGGMSDNPRPQLYGARYTALSAARVDEPATETVSVAGLHCESGDVLIDDVALPPPRVGDLLAVPATGAYTLAMSSNYNATPRPAAVLVRDGDGRLIRRRETVDDLLALEVPPDAS